MKIASKLMLVAALSVSSVALAQEGEGSGGGSRLRAPGALLDRSEQTSRSMLLSVHGLLPYGHFGLGGFPIGGGASFYIPLVKNGFIPPVNDEFGIEFGADAVAYLGYTYPFALYVPVGVQWKFHILDNLEAYVKAGFMPRLWFGHPAGFFYPDFYTAVGAHYFFSKGFGLKLEVGYPGVRFGVVFAF